LIHNTRRLRFASCQMLPALVVVVPVACNS
jgi:hypothetical protein